MAMALTRWVIALMSIGLSVGILTGCNQSAPSSAVSTAATAPSSQTSVTISWLAPDTNANGSALTDLAGYRIFYGTNAAALRTQIDVPSIGLTDYVIDGLDPNTTYYFAMRTYNSAGVESPSSAVVSMTTS